MTTEAVKTRRKASLATPTGLGADAVRDISGALTMLLGDPRDRVDVGPGSVVAVEPGTPLQVRNESDGELVLYIYGAPPVQEGADFFDDIGDL